MKEFEQTKALLKYRRGSMPLMYGDYRTLYVDDAVWVFVRHYMGEWVVVAINVRGAAAEVEVALPEFIDASNVGVAVGVEGAAVAAEGGVLKVSVPAYGYVIANNK
jgi:hypothetical protein